MFFVLLKIAIILGKNDPEKMDPKLFLPLVDNKLFPEKVRKFFQFGVAEFEPSLDENDAIKKHPDIVKANSLQHQNGQKKELDEQYTTYDEKNLLHESTDTDMNITL